MSQFFGNILEFLASPKHFNPQLPQLEADRSDDDWRSGKQRGCLHYGEWVYGQKHVSPSRTFFLATTIFVNPPSKKNSSPTKVIVNVSNIFPRATTQTSEPCCRREVLLLLRWERSELIILMVMRILMVILLF